MSLLKKLMVDTKSAWIEYPGLRGFELEIANLARPELIALRKRCTYQKFDRKTRQPVDTLDDEKFIAEFTKATIKSWKGLKLKHLETLLLVNIDGQDPETEIPFDVEDAIQLVSNSADFDSWVNEVVFDLDNFRTKSEGGTVESSGAVAE